MVREIKFRAWIKDLEIMDTVDFMDFIDEEITIIDNEGNQQIFTFSEIELMQYTGLEDKNGKEIYEGDIVEQSDGIPFKVVFKGDCWRAEPVDSTRQNRWLSYDLKVIGNIFENPELLEVSQ